MVLKPIGSPPPALRAALGMKDGWNDNPVFFSSEENLIGKSPDQCSAKVLVYQRKLLGMAENGVEGGVDVQQKVRAESGEALFVPTERFAHFRLGLGADDQFERHLRPLIRSRTTSQGDPWLGSW